MSDIFDPMVHEFIVETEEAVTGHDIAVAHTEGQTRNLTKVLPDGSVSTLAGCDEGDSSAFFRVDVDDERFNPKEMALATELGFQVFGVDVDVTEI